MMTVPHDVGATAKAHHHEEHTGPEQEKQNVLQLHVYSPDGAAADCAM
jgi:hypothetical protein